MTGMEPTATVNLPGAFCEWFQETGLAQGTDDADPEAKAARTAFEEARHVRAGRSYYLSLTGNTTVLNILAEYADYCLTANTDDPNSTEARAAHKVIARITAALTAMTSKGG